MTVVKIADLKNNLSSHLARVRKGGEITVLDRDTPIARIVPFMHGMDAEAKRTGKAGDVTADAQRVADPARQGIVTPGNPEDIAEWLEQHRPMKVPAGTPSGVDLLIAARRESRR
jgi:prevent-host-death family protein